MIYRDTYTLTLPFGKFLIRRPSLLTLVAEDRFPAELTSTVWKMQTGETSINKVMEDAATVKVWAAMVERLLPIVIVSPKVGDRTEVTVGEDGVMSGTIALASLPDVDKQLLVMCAMWAYPADEEKPAESGSGGVASGLKKFRDGDERPDARPSSEKVRSETF